MKSHTTPLKMIAVMLLALGWAPATTMAEPREPGLGEPVAVFAMQRGARSLEEVSKRAQALAEVMLGREVSSEAIQAALSKAERTRAGWHITLPEAAGLRLRYLPQVDELRFLNLDGVSQQVPASAMEEKEAVALVQRHVKELDRRGLIAARHYDLAAPEIGYGRIGGGAIKGGREYEQIVEYRITFLRALNGIPVANDGIRFGVHVSGQLTGMRLGGLTVASVEEDGKELPSAGTFRARTVSTDEIMRQFGASLPQDVKADVAWARVMYVMPEDVEHAVVEPLYVVSHALRYPGEHGETVVSRRKVLGYSMTDPAAAPIDFTAPAIRHDEKSKR